MKRRKRLQAGAPDRRTAPDRAEVRPLELATALSGQLRLQLDLIEQLVASQELLREENERARAVSQSAPAPAEAVERAPSAKRELDLDSLPEPAYRVQLGAEGAWAFTELSALARNLLFPNGSTATLQPDAFLERIHPDDRDAVAMSLRASEIQRGSQTFRLLDATGVYRRIEDRFRVEAGGEGRFGRLGLWLVDTQPRLEGSRADRLRAENERLEQHSREQARFLAQATHELRTPLNAILGLAQLIAETPPDDPEAARHLHTLEQHSQFLLALVNDVLDLSRFESGHTPLHPEAVDLPKLLRDAVEMVRPLARSKALELKLVQADNLPSTLYSDAMRVRQILLNLLANAIKFTSKGHVELAARLESDALILGVTDTGRGIAAKDLAAIFEPFEQGAGETLSPSGGTGLGLAIARKWADALGATLSVRSTPGEGSCFELHLPLGASAPKTPTAPPQASAPRVLLVEDNPLNQRLTAQQIEKLGYAVTVADTAQEAVAVLERERFDILLVDKRLPDLDGFALVERLQGTAGFRSDPPGVFALSASTSAEDRQEAEKLGFAGYLTKPIDNQTLRNELARVAAPKAASPKPATKESKPSNPADVAPVAPTATTSPEPPKAFSHIDLNELRRVMDGEQHETFVAQAISLFLETSPNLLGSLQRALERGDRKTVSRLAHSLKANSQLLGASQLHDISQKLEVEAEKEDLTQLQTTADALLSEYRMVSNELERLEATLGTAGEKP